VQGRKPLPSHIKLITQSHNLRKDSNEPEPLGDLVEPPEDLSEREKVIWRRTISRAPIGMLRQLDSDVLRVYCETWCEREEARAKVREFGSIIKHIAKIGKDGQPIYGDPKRSPYLSVVSRTTDVLIRLIGDLGFNPSSRSRISVTGAGKGASNKFAKNAATNRA
jgi:P27 family predicted phage terminase small subunit